MTLIDRLAGLKALGEKALPLPWVVEGSPPNMRIVFAGTEPPRSSPFMLFLDGDQEATAAFVLALVNALPEIVVGVTELVGERERATTAGRDIGRDQEREAVTRYLRIYAAGQVPNLSRPWFADALFEIAQNIEDGDHIRALSSPRKDGDTLEKTDV